VDAVRKLYLSDDQSSLPTNNPKLPSLFTSRATVLEADPLASQSIPPLAGPIIRETFEPTGTVQTILKKDPFVFPIPAGSLKEVSFKLLRAGPAE
jgi:hypothetical protein